MKEISSLCEINETGQLKIIRRNEFDMAVKLAPKGRYFLTIKKLYRKRSLNQNAYYHGVVIPLVKEGLYDAGYKLSNGVVHEYLKEQFLRKEIVNEQSGEIITVNGSTAELTTTEFNDYLYEIIEWSKEYLNITIPLPNEFEDN